MAYGITDTCVKTFPKQTTGLRCLRSNVFGPRGLDRLRRLIPVSTCDSIHAIDDVPETMCRKSRKTSLKKNAAFYKH
jgi:hypothetical protein